MDPVKQVQKEIQAYHKELYAKLNLYGSWMDMLRKEGNLLKSRCETLKSQMQNEIVDKQNIGEGREGQIIPRKKVFMVIHLSQSHHKHRHH